MANQRSKVLIIAEAGVNHNGSLELALKLADEAKKAGADIVKYQTAKAENVISQFAPKAEYQKETTGADESQLDMVKKLMLPFDNFSIIKEHCKEIGIGFLSTPFELTAIDYLDKLGCDVWKIPSGEITNLPYLKKIADTGKDVIMSTGMSNLEEIKAAIDLLKSNGARNISLMHCNTEYPTPFCDVNLNAMKTMREATGLEVGYSDHTPGIEVPIAAVAMGATIIEKHFTLDKNMEGPDHKASLEPDELRAMICAIRNIEKAMGDGEKKSSPSETPNKIVARKSIVASKDIKAGEILSEDNLTTKRPGNGISPMRWDEIIGQVAKRDFATDELIEVQEII